MAHIVGFINKRVKEKLDDIGHSTTEDKEKFIEVWDTIDCLKKDICYGSNIPKKLIPKAYKKIGIKNLWIVDLEDGWRFFYTIASDGGISIAAIIDFMSHDEYERLMHYHEKK